MIGDEVRLEGAAFKVKHVRCKQGLIHSVLRVNSNRMYVPQHDRDGIVHDAEWTDEPVLTCFTCINHVWKDSLARDMFADVDEGDD